jgi:uncharacterized protein YejL (UPF0352 family)
MQSIWEHDTNKYYKKPIIMFDYSGSTTVVFEENNGLITTVFDNLVTLSRGIARNDGFDTAHIIVWASNAMYLGEKNITTLIPKDFVGTIGNGGTDLSQAFNILDDTWITNDPEYYQQPVGTIVPGGIVPGGIVPGGIVPGGIVPGAIVPGAIVPGAIVPIYVFTDGEIDRGEKQLSDKIKNIYDKSKVKYDIRLIVLENNSTNYHTKNCSTGNALVKIVRNNNLSNNIKYILFFNKIYRDFENKFINLYNASLPEYYVQYDDKCFHIKDYAIFLEYISNAITNIKKILNCNEVNIDGTEMLTNHNMHTEYGKLEKIGYNLIRTIKDLEIAFNTRNGFDKSQKSSKYNANIFTRVQKKFNKRQMIDFFCNIIKDDDIAQYLKRELIYGIDNKTFQEYKEKREKLFSNTQLDMYANLRKSIDKNTQCSYVSFIEHNLNNITKSYDVMVYDINTIEVEHSAHFGFREYKSATVYDTKNKKLIPILPICGGYTHNNGQATRQWIRAIYSKKYGIPAGSDLIHYTFLIDNMYVQLSDLPEGIKIAYNNLTYTMMIRIRFGQSIKEYMYLLKGEKPEPVGSDVKFEDFIKLCPNFPQFSDDLNISVMNIWYMILSCMKHDNLIDIARMQQKYCGNTERFHNFNDIKRIIEQMNILPIYNKLIIDTDNTTPNYYCFITLCDTEDDGGYMFYKHKNDTNNTVCYPNYVICHEAYDMYNNNTVELKCPYCSMKIDLNKMTKIGPLQYEQEINNTNTQITPIYQNVYLSNPRELDDLDYSNILDISYDIVKLDEIDFSNNYSDNVVLNDHIIFGNAMCNYSMLNNRHIFKNGVSYQLQQEFNKRMPQFLLEIDMKNIVVAGGACRSVLLDQKIQDIDIFFVGLTERGIKDRLLPLINNIINILQTHDNDIRFIVMYKPLNNVVELLCTKSTFNDSNISIDEANDDFVINEKFMFAQNEIIHKIQIILRQNDDIQSIFHDFDIHASCVAFDGAYTYFNEASYIAYKYMINVVEKHKAQHRGYNYRLLKYYNYGFSIGIIKKHLDDNIIEKLYSHPTRVSIHGCTFDVSKDFDPELKLKYIPIDNFTLDPVDNEIDDEIDNEIDNEIGSKIGNKIHSDGAGVSMYKSYDMTTMADGTGADAMTGLYNYMLENDIKFCYVDGEFEEQQIKYVIDIEQLEFLKHKRDDNINWYDNSKIIIE